MLSTVAYSEGELAVGLRKRRRAQAVGIEGGANSFVLVMHAGTNFRNRMRWTSFVLRTSLRGASARAPDVTCP